VTWFQQIFPTLTTDLFAVKHLGIQLQENIHLKTNSQQNIQIPQHKAVKESGWMEETAQELAALLIQGRLNLVWSKKQATINIFFLEKRKK
jgi:hypothetical protein